MWSIRTSIHVTLVIELYIYVHNIYIIHEADLFGIILMTYNTQAVLMKITIINQNARDEKKKFKSAILKFKTLIITFDVQIVYL